MTTLLATKRQDVKNSNTVKDREEGHFPAIVYGRDKPNIPIYVDEIAFTKALREAGRNGIIQLDMNPNSTEKVMLQDMQVDSIKGQVLHADFYIVDMKAKVTVDVNVHLVGEAQGIKDGGILQQPLHQVTVKSLPGDIPDVLEINIDSMVVGDTLQLSDIPKSTSYEIIGDEDTVIASILPPMTEEVVDSGEVQDGGELEENHGEVERAEDEEKKEE